jgi:hypothetical protein
MLSINRLKKGRRWANLVRMRRSVRRKHIVAKVTAQEVPIAVPISWTQKVSSNWKTLHLVNSVSRAMVSSILSCGVVVSSSNHCQIEAIPRFKSMFEYMLIASAVNRRAFGGRSRRSRSS